MLRRPLEQMGHGIYYSFSFCLNCYTFLRTVSLSSVLSGLASDQTAVEEGLRCCPVEMLSATGLRQELSLCYSGWSLLFTSAEGSVVAVFLHCHTLQFKVILSPCSHQATGNPAQLQISSSNRSSRFSLETQAFQSESVQGHCYTPCCEKDTCNHSS